MDMYKLLKSSSSCQITDSPDAADLASVEVRPVDLASVTAGVSTEISPPFPNLLILRADFAAS